MNNYEIKALQNLIREHNRQHDREFRFCFKKCDDSCRVWSAKGDTIFYGEALAGFVYGYALEMLIMPSESKGVFICIQ